MGSGAGGELLQGRGSLYLEIPLPHTQGWEVGACAPSTRGAEAGDQFRLHSETLSLNKSTREI